jgi:hypothetical protein
VYLKRLGQWILAVFHKWRAVAALSGIVLASSSRFTGYLPSQSEYVLTQVLVISGYLVIGWAVFLAWKAERDQIEDAQYRPLLATFDGLIQFQEYAGSTFDLCVPVMCSGGEIYDAKAIIYVNFGGRFNALPSPARIPIGHLAVGQKYSLLPPRMNYPSDIANIAQTLGRNFDFNCHLTLNFTSARTGLRYSSEELIVYTGPPRNRFDVRRPKPPRALTTETWVGRRRLINSLRAWLDGMSA